MSKFIRVTEDYTMECVKEFIEALHNLRMTDGKIQYTKILGMQNRRAKLFFTPNAWTKMQLLVKGFDKEVAWHGVAHRGENHDADEYIISDILVYPQEVTGTTVDTDQEEYEKWLCDLPDEVFNNLRMQGHSHVNMSTSPSGVDTTHQEKILQQLDEDMFYIFLIWNKSNSSWIKIYDFAKNAMFESSDIDVRIVGEDFNRGDFMKEARDLVKTPKTTYTPGAGANSPYGSGYGGSYYGGGYGGYGGGYGGGHQKPATVVPEKKDPEPEKKSPVATGSATGSAMSAKGTENAEKAGGDDGWRNNRSFSGGFYDDDDEENYWGGRNYSDPFYARGY